MPTIRPEPSINFLYQHQGKSHPLQLQPLVQKLDETELLSLLNSKPSPPPLNLPVLKGPRAADLLRQSVDEWVATGRGPSGYESPASRNFVAAQDLGNRLYEASKYRFSLLPIGNRLEPWIPDPAPDVMIGSDTQRANSMLLKLFLSDLRLRIAKCVSCNVYFVLQRVSTYKSGTRCKECRAARRISTAIASTTLGRTEAERELYGLAAAHFRRVITNNAEWHESDKVRRNMIEYLNGKILKSEKLSSIYYAPPRSGLTTKWLARARNRDGIMAAFRAAGVE